MRVTRAEGLQLKEGTAINKALFHLQKILLNLSAEERPDYRGHDIGKLMKDSLGGTAKAAMIANLSPGVRSLDETHRTLE